MGRTHNVCMRTSEAVAKAPKAGWSTSFFLPYWNSLKPRPASSLRDLLGLELGTWP